MLPQACSHSCQPDDGCCQRTVLASGRSHPLCAAPECQGKSAGIEILHYKLKTELINKVLEQSRRRGSEDDVVDIQQQVEMSCEALEPGARRLFEPV